jgi:hypothetical protein
MPPADKLAKPTHKTRLNTNSGLEKLKEDFRAEKYYKLADRCISAS